MDDMSKDCKVSLATIAFVLVTISYFAACEVKGAEKQAKLIAIAIALSLNNLLIASPLFSVTLIIVQLYGNLFFPKLPLGILLTAYQ